MKKIVVLTFFFLSVSIVAQKYYTKTGKTKFKASVDTFEPVEATNNSTTAIINTTSGEIASLLFVKAFNFRVALMQEHFNENYMDASKYPKGTFKGTIVGFNLSEISDTKKYILKGILTIRDVEKEIETFALFSKKEDKLLMQASFEIQPASFNIKIPKIVRNKIARTITISLAYEFIEKKNKLVIIILLVIAFGVGAIYAYVMKAPVKIESKKVDFTGTSDQLLLKILEDPAAWQDKIVVISGKVTSLDDKGILLSASIYCQLKDTTVLKKINPTNDISLKGRIIGYDDLLEELKLDQCIIQ